MARAGRSPSALTSTGLFSARTPHSSDGADGILPVGPSQAEDLTHRAADDALVVEARELEGAAAAAG